MLEVWKMDCHSTTKKARQEPIVAAQMRPELYVPPEDTTLERPNFLMLPTEVQIQVITIILTTMPISTVESFLQAVPEVHYLVSIYTDYTQDTPYQIQIPWYFTNVKSIMSSDCGAAPITPIRVLFMSNFYEIYTRSPSLALKLYSKHITKGTIVYVLSFGKSVFGERDLNELLVRSTGVSHVVHVADDAAVRDMHRDLDFTCSNDRGPAIFGMSPDFPPWFLIPQSIHPEMRYDDAPLWNLRKLLIHDADSPSRGMEASISLYNYHYFRHGGFKWINHVRWKTVTCSYRCEPAQLRLNEAVNLKSLYVEYHGGKAPIVSCDTKISKNADSFTFVNTSWSDTDHNGTLCEHGLSVGVEDQAAWTLNPFEYPDMTWCRRFENFTFIGMPDTLLDLIPFDNAESIHWKRLTPRADGSMRRLDWVSILCPVLRVLTIEAFLQDNTENPIPKFQVPWLQSLVLKQVKGSTGSFWKLEELISRYPALIVESDQYGVEIGREEEMVYPSGLRELYFLGTMTESGDYLAFDIGSPGIFKECLTRLVVSGYVLNFTSELSLGLEYPRLRSLTVDISRLPLADDGDSLYPAAVLDFGPCSFPALAIVHLDAGHQPQLNSPVVGAQATLQLVNYPTHCPELLVSQKFQRNALRVNGASLVVGDAEVSEEGSAAPAMFRVWRQLVYARGGPGARVFHYGGVREVADGTPL